MTFEPPIVLIDGGDLACARLLILLRNRVAALKDGTLVHLSTTDPVAPIDLPAWCRMTGHIYLGTVEGAASPAYAIRVSAHPAPTDERHPWRPARANGHGQPSCAPAPTHGTAGRAPRPPESEVGRSTV
jgi:tRNA 2-thiouridine synthesizing protein A